MKYVSIAGMYCSITTEEGKRTPVQRNGQYRNQYTLGKATESCRFTPYTLLLGNPAKALHHAYHS